MISCDICVVGSGPSSYAFVSRYLLKYPDSDILVIEAGSSRFPKPEFNELLPKSIGRDLKIRPTINIGIGGTSELWHGVLTPFDEIDFEHRHWIENSGWPIKIKDLEKSYRSVSKNIFDIEFDTFLQQVDLNHSAELANLGYSWSEEDFETKAFIQPKRIFRGFKKWKMLASRVSFLKGYTALRFRAHIGNTKRLEIGDYSSGSLLTIQAKRYILSAGALNTPRILLNSEEGMFNNINIGCFLNDHAMGNLGQIGGNIPLSTKLFSGIKHYPGKIKYALRPTEEFQKKNKIGNSVLYPRASFSEGEFDRTEALKRTLLTVRGEIFRGHLPVNLIREVFSDINLSMQIINYKFGLFPKSKFIDFFLVQEGRPNNESKLVLSNELDRFGLPKANIDWKLKPEDLLDAKTMVNSLMRSLSLPTDWCETYNLDIVNWGSRLSSAAHHSGSCRMAVDETSGVVDLNCAIFGHDDVFIADASVFPTNGNGNITLTAMAIANRVADLIDK